MNKISQQKKLSTPLKNLLDDSTYRKKVIERTIKRRDLVPKSVQKVFEELIKKEIKIPEFKNPLDRKSVV